MVTPFFFGVWINPFDFPTRIIKRRPTLMAIYSIPKNMPKRASRNLQDLSAMISPYFQFSTYLFWGWLWVTIGRFPIDSFNKSLNTNDSYDGLKFGTPIIGWFILTGTKMAVVQVFNFHPYTYPIIFRNIRNLRSNHSINIPYRKLHSYPSISINH